MTTASKITLARIAFIPLFMFCLYMSGGVVNVWAWVSLGVFIVASITDFVDGEIARRCNQVTNFGKFLDPLADKLLVVAAMVIFCEWGTFPGWALMIVLTREFAVTGLRLVAVGKGNVIAAGKSGKLKTVCTMLGLGVLMVYADILWIRWTVISIILVTTVYSGAEYFIRNWKCLWND